MTHEIIFQGKEATVLQLALFRILIEGPLADTVLAERLQLHPQRARELFEALAAGGLLERNGDRYANIGEVDRLLEQANGGAANRLVRRVFQLFPLLLVLAVGALLFQGWFGPHGMPPTVQSLQLAPNSANGAVPAPTHGSIGTRSVSAQGTGDDLYTYYLVGSQEQADVVESQVQTEAANPLVAAGKALNHEIIIIHSPEEEAFIREVLGDAENEASAVDKVPFRVVDLRRGASAKFLTTESEGKMVSLLLAHRTRGGAGQR